jgi:hypothetical protein
MLAFPQAITGMVMNFAATAKHFAISAKRFVVIAKLIR